MRPCCVPRDYLLVDRGVKKYGKMQNNVNAQFYWSIVAATSLIRGSLA